MPASSTRRGGASTSAIDLYLPQEQGGARRRLGQIRAKFLTKMRRLDEAELERCEEWERPREEREEKKRERERELGMAERATEVEDERRRDKRAKEGDTPKISRMIFKCVYFKGHKNAHEK